MKKYFLALLFLPATFVHELSHFLMARILFVQVNRFDLIPKIVGNEFRLGSVTTIKTDLIRESLIGIAPFFVGIAIIYLLTTINVSLLSLYILFQTVHSMFLSFSDVKAIIKLIIITLLIMAIFVILK